MSEMENVHTILVVQPEGKTPLGRLEDVKIHKEDGDEDNQVDGGETTSLNGGHQRNYCSSPGDT
jgi:hypothetical protein